MIVIGIDPHKKTHTAVALDATTGELLAELTVSARGSGHAEVLVWARSHADERCFALEESRHISVSLERFLLASGEEVVRVPPKLMAGARRSGRSRGKSDAIDAAAVARASLREPRLPVARLDGPEREIRLLVDHRGDPIGERTRIQQRLRWHLHELYPEFELPAGCLDRAVWLKRLGRRLARCEQSVQIEICRDLLLRCCELIRRAAAIERNLKARVQAQAEPLLALSGCGVLTAAMLLGETAGAARFSGEAKLAMHAGAAALAASSGARRRHRLNRSGNRQLTAPCTASPSPKGACTRPPASTWPARKRRATRARKPKPFAASSATSPVSSTAHYEPSRKTRSRRRTGRRRHRP